MKRSVHVLWWLCPLLLTLSCKPSKPKGVLSEGRMAAVLVDFHLAQGMAEGQEKKRVVGVVDEICAAIENAAR